MRTSTKFPTVAVVACMAAGTAEALIGGTTDHVVDSYQPSFSLDSAYDHFREMALEILDANTNTFCKVPEDLSTVTDLHDLIVPVDCLETVDRLRWTIVERGFGVDTIRRESGAVNSCGYEYDDFQRAVNAYYANVDRAADNAWEDARKMETCPTETTIECPTTPDEIVLDHTPLSPDGRCLNAFVTAILPEAVEQDVRRLLPTLPRGHGVFKAL